MSPSIAVPVLNDLGVRARLLLSETHVLYLAARHPQTPWHAKALLAAVVAYALSPIDLIPDFVPILGLLDDLILIPLGIVVATKLVQAEVLTECRDRVRNVASAGLPASRAAAVVIIGVWVMLGIYCIVWMLEARGDW